jgi:hypothetical protein
MACMLLERIAGVSRRGRALAGSGAGTAVTVAVTFATSFAYPNGFPTPNYIPHVTPSQGCLVSVTGKTQLGFNVILTPVPGY